MARNPKPVRRQYKQVQARIRRGTYPYPPPSYDQLNPMKRQFFWYAVTRRMHNLRRAMGNVAPALVAQMTGIAARLQGVLPRRSYHYQDDYRLVE